MLALGSGSWQRSHDGKGHSHVLYYYPFGEDVDEKSMASTSVQAWQNQTSNIANSSSWSLYIV
jgi:hypothetical protein